VESPLPGNRHDGFGERPGETDRKQFRHRAPGRLNHSESSRRPRSHRAPSGASERLIVPDTEQATDSMQCRSPNTGTYIRRPSEPDKALSPRSTAQMRCRQALAGTHRMSSSKGSTTIVTRRCARGGSALAMCTHAATFWQRAERLKLVPLMSQQRGRFALSDHARRFLDP
jgi:hypothetical protein